MKPHDESLSLELSMPLDPAVRRMVVEAVRADGFLVAEAGAVQLRESADPTQTVELFIKVVGLYAAGRYLDGLVGEPLKILGLTVGS